MNIAYTGRHTKVTEEIKEYMEKRLFQKVKFYYDEILNVNVILEIQRGQYIFEVKVVANHDVFLAKEASADWDKAIDAVTDKIAQSAKKQKEKVKSHR